MFKNGDFLMANFKDDEILGTGKLYYKNGDCYEGEFNHGLPIGKGKLYRD